MQLPKPQKKRGYCMTSFKIMAEIERLNSRLKVLQDAFQRDIDGSWFSDKFSLDVDQALKGEVES